MQDFEKPARRSWVLRVEEAPDELVDDRVDFDCVLSLVVPRQIVEQIRVQKVADEAVLLRTLYTFSSLAYFSEESSSFWLSVACFPSRSFRYTCSHLR